MEYHLHRLANFQRFHVAVDDVRQHARAFFELYVCHDVRAIAIVSLAATVHREAVDRAAPAGFEPGYVEAAARRAERARIPDHRVARAAAWQQQLGLRRGVPERLGFRIDLRRRRWQPHLGCVCHASSWPRINVALPIREPMEPPVPCASAMSQLGTCTSGFDSPRNCRTASRILVIPPRLAGWLLHNPPPSVLKGSLPPGESSAPSCTNWPPLPFSQKPRSSICSSTVIVKES